MVLGKAPIRSRSARPVGALSTPPRPVDSSTQVHAVHEDNGEIESRSQTDRDDIESENLD